MAIGKEINGYPVKSYTYGDQIMHREESKWECKRTLTASDNALSWNGVST